ncbi:MFS transporter [Planobispora longispora]|uniref:MFS transporter n=1 Tax=Planobispora longispora TaxID=28887 RepID=A0A8J3W583_9ACTN|nr:MFS transporter [Planobispora longispora]GIH76532.1 MFS transporter [Planobispora longispora]
MSVAQPVPDPPEAPSPSSAPVSAGGPPPALAEPTRRVGPWWVAGISLANLALWMGYFGPLQVLLPSQAAQISPGGKETALAVVTGAGAAVAMLTNPIVGALSDRTARRAGAGGAGRPGRSPRPWGRFGRSGLAGRRHPWTLAGALAGAGALVLLAGQSTIIGMVIGWCLAQAGLNMMQASLNAGVPDHVPVRQRGEVSGWIGIPQSLGVVLAVVLVTMVATTVDAGYLLIAALIPLCALPFVLTTADPPLGSRPPFDARAFLRSFRISPRAHPDFFWAWLTRFLMQLGNATATLYLLYFLADAVGYERLFPGEKAEDGLLVLILIYTAAVVLTTVVAGVVSDRLGRRKTLVTVSGLIGAVPAVMLAFWPLWPVTMAGAAILGIGFGVYLSVDNALVTQVLPTAEGRAKDLGVINIANSGPQVLGPVIAGPIVAGAGGYPVLYLVSAALVLLGAGLVWKIRSVP